MLLGLGFLSYDIFALLKGGGITPGDLAKGQALTDTMVFRLSTTLPLLWYAVEVLTMLTNKKRRALHDFIGGTVVVRTNPEQRGTQGAAPNSGLEPVLGK